MGTAWLCPTTALTPTSNVCGVSAPMGKKNGSELLGDTQNMFLHSISTRGHELLKWVTTFGTGVQPEYPGCQWLQVES